MPSPSFGPWFPPGVVKKAMAAPGILHQVLARSYDLLYGIGLGTFGFLFDGPSPMPQQRASAPTAPEARLLAARMDGTGLAVRVEEAGGALPQRG